MELLVPELLKVKMDISSIYFNIFILFFCTFSLRVCLVTKSGDADN